MYAQLGVSSQNPDLLKVAVFACATMVFYATTRLGEFTVLILSFFDPSLHIEPSNVTYSRDRSGHQSTAFFIPQTKTAVYGETVSWTKQNNLSDPEEAL